MAERHIMLVGTADPTPGDATTFEPTLTTRGRQRVDALSLGPVGQLPETNRAKAANFQAAAAGAGKIMRYWAACETAGAAAEFRLYLGIDNTAANELCHVKLAAGQSAREALSIDSSSGIYCERLAGTFDLTIIP